MSMRKSSKLKTSLLHNLANPSSRQLTVILAIYLFSCLNLTLLARLLKIWDAMPEVSILFTATVPVFFIAAFAVLLTPFSFKYLLKPVFVTIILLSATVNYATYTFGIIFNKDMMLNFAETSTAEAASYLNFRLIVWMVLTAVIPSLYVIFANVRHQRIGNEMFSKLVTMVVCFGIIGVIAVPYYKDYASIARNNQKMQKDIVPTYAISSAVKFIHTKYFAAKMIYQPIGKDAAMTVEPNRKPHLTIVVVGETARAQNYELGGYSRETNFYTKTIKNILYYKNVTSCGTATAVSMPCMFSLLGMKNYSRAAFDSQDNVIDFLNNAGMKSIWIDNNTGAKGIAAKTKYIRTSEDPLTKCGEEECVDEVMLPIIDREIKTMQGNPVIIFVHGLGSHGPTYYKRYPREFAFFKPECMTSDLTKCSQQQIINTYDNTLRYTDHFISKLIERLQDQEEIYDTALLYASDHGESLGEGGIYLHGFPYAVAPDTQKRVPMMAWFSDEMLAHKGLTFSCMKKMSEEQSFSHDNLSHTILDLMDVTASEINLKKSLLEQCR